MDNRPIGVFDSGLGGLTVVKELQKIMDEQIIYFGDTGRVPYGTRSVNTITKYAHQDISFLQSKNVKMIIAACGTVSAVFQKEEQNKISADYTGVLIPAVQTAARVTKTGVIGVIGTTATIKSDKYRDEILKILPAAQVIQIACPMFVPLVENGFIDDGNAVSTLVARQYLEPFVGEVDTLILGCTHFPILSRIIGDIVGSEVTLVDPGKEAARYAKNLLTQKDMQSDGKRSISYFVSDDPESFEATASVFLEGWNHDGKVQKINIAAF